MGESRLVQSAHSYLVDGRGGGSGCQEGELAFAALHCNRTARGEARGCCRANGW